MDEVLDYLCIESDYMEMDHVILWIELRGAIRTCADYYEWKWSLNQKLNI